MNFRHHEGHPVPGPISQNYEGPMGAASEWEEHPADTHTEHCCVVHGCKYNDPECTVVKNKLPIKGCEECGLEEEAKAARSIREWGSIENHNKIETALRRLYADATFMMVGEPLGILDLIDRTDLSNKLRISMTEQELRIIRFALERAKESL